MNDGVTNIAIFYFFAQVIERFLELIDWILSFFIQPKEGAEAIKRKSAKMIGMWFLACALSFLFVYFFKLYLMKRLGMDIETWLDMVFTSIVLGSGTKPIHDVISLMDRGKKAKL